MNIDLVTIIVAAGFVVMVEIYLIWQYFNKHRRIVLEYKATFVVEVNKWKPDPLQSKMARQYSIARRQKAYLRRDARPATDLRQTRRSHSVIATTSEELQ